MGISVDPAQMAISVDPAQNTMSITACPECGMIHLPNCAMQRKIDRDDAYYLALELVERVDFHLDHLRHFKTNDGHRLHKLDQVVPAILNGQIEELPGWCKSIEEVLCNHSLSS